MTRVNIYAPADEHDYTEPELAGWFDRSKADGWTDRDYNGNGSGGTGRGTAVYRTAGGKWVLEHWSCWQGEADHHEYISGEQARDWLLRNDEDAAVARYFGEIAEEEDRRPGRPAIGEPVNVRLGDMLGPVDAYAAEHGMSRGAAVRALVGEALTATQPYAVTALDISTRVRETLSRHSSLAAAIEVLREEEAYDAEDNGLPSRHPRVEHDGLPVHTEAMGG